MAMPIIPVPQYPNVPNAPGVPPLSRASRAQNSIVLATNVLGFVRQIFLGAQWGIFSEDGLPLLLGDSVKGFDYKNDSRLADFPIEKGGFGNYNKVQTPWDARFSFTVGGSDAARAQFLTTCEKLIKNLTMVVGVTPEITYPSANVSHYDLRRTSTAGVTLLTVDVWLQEVRQTATRSFANANTAEPSGTDTVNGGTVQPQTPTAGQEAALPAPEQGGLY